MFPFLNKHRNSKQEDNEIVQKTVKISKIHLWHCVKSYGHLCQILALFTMPTHQIWSYHVI